jgi:hypothetical protein
MRTHMYLVSVMATLVVAIASPSHGASNLNSSRSNIYRLVYAPAVTSAQATAILAELDRVKPRGDADETTVRAIVQKHIGAIKSARGENLVIVVRPAGGPQTLKSILILEIAGDEAAAIAVSDEGAGGPKPVKGKSGAK